MDAQGAIWHPSPNFGARRGGLRPSLIVLHYTAMQGADAALERLCDPLLEVSAHYLIGSDGRLWQMVREDARAWHAGAGEWLGQGDVNSRSVGIELDNTGATPFSNPLMTTLEGLLPEIMRRWSIAPRGVIGHSDMAPERKQDPGARFDWARLARGGLADISRPVGPELPDLARFRDALLRYGYPDVGEDALLEAFRQRFRQWFCQRVSRAGQGPLDSVDMAIALGLSASD